MHETRKISDKNGRFSVSCAIIQVITNVKRAVCEEAKLKRIFIRECQANYMNTLAQRESDCTFSAGLIS